MTVIELAEYLAELEKTSSRLKITEILADLFRKTEPGEIKQVVYLILGSLAPEYQSLVFNIADRMMVEVIAFAYNKPPESVRQLYKLRGDLGTVAQELAPSGNGSQSVGELYSKLRGVAIDEGEGSQERKIQKMAEILSGLDPLSARYVARIPVGKLRLGFSDKTILDALAFMENGDKSKKQKLEQAFQVLPDIGSLAERVKEKGIEEASRHIEPVVGIPVQAMLAQRLKSPQEMIAKMKKVGVEPKLDGLRILIHVKKGKDGFVKAYTRNLHEVSWMFPELKNSYESLNVDEVILDSEAIGLDETRKAMADFQSTMTRRRKHDIQDIAAKVAIQFYVFDILAKDGTGLMNRPYYERRKILDSALNPGKLFQITKYTITEDFEEIKKLHLYYRSNGLEGIIVKRFDSSYVPGRTGWRWVKMKEAEDALGKLSDTIDCVIMGYSMGKGKRAEFGIGQFLVGIIKENKYLTLTKVGTGLSDDQFRFLQKKLKTLTVKDKPQAYEVTKVYEPDYWVDPSVVVEIAGDDLTKSPQHTSGYGLRFPRLVKIRTDKNPLQATGYSEVKDLYDLQVR